MSEHNRSGLHIFFYMVLITALAASGYFNYLYFISKTQPSKAPAACGGFEQLPQEVQAFYVDKVLYDQLKTSCEKAEGDLNASKTAAAAAPERIEAKPTRQTLAKEELHAQRLASQDVTMVKAFAKCYDMGNASYKISGQCRNDIISYVDRHRDAKYFEIIALVDDQEFRLFKQLEHDPKMVEALGLNKKLIDKMKKFTQKGLGKHRAAEASWVIKSYTKREAATYNANYELISKKGHRGVIIRAYR